ncbi:restriction endonuclease subunit S [Vibrio cholerae]|uniref:restriction endonuclease subunit S n=1 Tax=Vibrio cholerae TaxID=666 RepID=UPI000E0C9428|nr:restriction endonuclease subunit S [Vibrio cholerae]EKF9826281.1 restriction endonuclease subunit S [Vibrio cholerae]ELJ8466825.1 restriction endonuclease subunit S [Vibrio cholerae]QKU59795.1 restriction endonuclease subunit S [Vibrio cholerae]RNE83198.1 restriction endonuclease subunit S [Vibrio cholerae]HDZ3690876.1 restriction endonuclease subunit S [Vibrio cholerae]
MEFVTLGDLFKISSGGTPSRREKSYYDNGDIPWIKTGDLHKCRIQQASEYITQLGLDKSSAKLFPKGTVLLAMYGATIGACSILDIEAATNQACAAFLPNEKVDTNYLYYFLISKKNDFIRDGVGGAQPNISATYLKTVSFPLPPLETQKQIAAVLEKADQLRKDCKLLEQELNSLAQSVFIDMFVGKDFPLVNLEDLASNKKHALSSGPFGSALSSKHYTDEGVLVLRGLNTTKGKIDLSKTKYISQEKYEELKRSKLSVNDVVVVAVGSSGFAISIPDGFPEAVMSQNFNKISPNMDLIVPKYLEFAINSSFVQRQFSREITDTVRTFLSLTKLKKVQIPLPPLELQKQFLSTIKSILKEEELNQEFVSEMDNCFSSLMQKAFKGELTL